MKRIVLVRHGESLWNKENRFTGWVNVDLSENGVVEAQNAGQLMKEAGFYFDRAYTSYLKRAVKTLNIALDTMNQDWIPVKKSWRLNEKHYGELQGLNKAETAAKFGDEQVYQWRRGFDVAPRLLADDSPFSSTHDPRYKDVPSALLPKTESLKDCIARVMPYWECEIFPSLMACDQVIVVAHGNSLRGIVKHLKQISDTDISLLNIPTATPYVFEFDNSLQLLRDYYLGDQEEIQRKQQAVANQGKRL